MSTTDDRGEFSLKPPRKRPSAHDSPGEIPAELLEESSNFTLYVSDVAMIGIRTHASTDPDREVGGVLIGRHYKSGSRVVVIVNEHCPLPTSSSSRVHFTYGDESYRCLHQTFQPTSERYVVGWFHSHPRLGDPFMSSADIRVHKENFKEPWHVSFVVGAGEWALPVGYWRMADGQLIEIDNLYIHMTAAESLGEQSRRYARACLIDEHAGTSSINGTASALTKLSLPEHSAVGMFLDAISGDVRQLNDQERRTLVDGAINLALKLTESAQDLEIAKRFQEELKLLRFHGDAFQLIALSDEQATAFAVCNDHIVSLIPSTYSFLFHHLTSSISMPITVQPPKEFIDVAASPEGDIWILTKKGELGKIANSFWVDFHDSVPLLGFLTSELPGEPLEIAVHDSSIWIRTASCATEYRPSDQKKGGRRTSPVRSVELRQPNTVLLRPPGGDNVFISVSGETIATLNAEGQITAEASLPDSWKAHTLKQACSCSEGLLLLFEKDSNTFLGLFDSHSLLLRAYFADDAQPGDQQPIVSIAADRDGRAYLQKGMYQYQLRESEGSDAS